MATIDLSQLPVPAVVKELDYETIYNERKAVLLSVYPEDQRAAVAHTLMLESEPLVKLLQESAYRELLWYQRVNEAARAGMVAFALGSDLDQLGATFNVTCLVITPADDSTLPPTPALLESDSDFRLRIQQAFEGLSVAGSVGAYQYHGRSANGRVPSGRKVNGKALTADITLVAGMLVHTPKRKPILKWEWLPQQPVMPTITPMDAYLPGARSKVSRRRQISRWSRGMLVHTPKTKLILN